MFSRVLSTSLIILGMTLAGCGVATEQVPAQQPVSAAPTTEPAAPLADALAPAVVEETPAAAATSEPVAPADPAITAAEAAPATTEPVAPVEAAATTAESAPAAAEEAVAAQPETVEANSVLRTFQVISDRSEATYQVQEEFFNRPVSIVNPIGRTQAIEGEFQLNINGSQVQLVNNQFLVDLRTLTSDEARRDQRIRDQWLESNTYPWAEFKATAIENFPENVAEGQEVSFKVVGDLTIRELTRPQTFDVTARLDGNTFTGQATTYLLMRDYGFEPPSILGILEVADGVTVTVNFVAEEVKTGS